MLFGSDEINEDLSFPHVNECCNEASVSTSAASVGQFHWIGENFGNELFKGPSLLTEGQLANRKIIKTNEKESMRGNSNQSGLGNSAITSGNNHYCSGESTSTGYINPAQHIFMDCDESHYDGSSIIWKEVNEELDSILKANTVSKAKRLVDMSSEEHKMLWKACDKITNSNLMRPVRGEVDVSRDFEYQASKIIDFLSEEDVAFADVLISVAHKDFMMEVEE